MRCLTHLTALAASTLLLLASASEAVPGVHPSLHDILHVGTPGEAQGNDGNSTWCKDCLVFLTLARDVAEGKLAQEVGEFLADEYCLINHGGLGYTCRGDWACHDLCDNIVKLFGPEVLDIASQLLLDPSRDCVSLGFCPAPNATLKPFAPPPPPPTDAAVRAQLHAAEDIFRVVHVSDIHWDPEYRIGGNADCGEPLCCRQTQGPATSPNTTCGVFGDHAGDTPLSLLKSMLEAIADLNPDAVFATGDDPPHNVWNQTEEFNTGCSVNMSNLWRQYWPGIQVFPGLGNHNGLPINQFHTDPTKDADWLYNPLAEAYATWLPEAALATFRQAGYYTMTVPGMPQWRVVVLNMGLHVSENYWTLLNNDVNLGNMSDWLAATLQQAAAGNESVFILGHYPPNDGSYWENWMEGTFEPLLRQYHTLVRGMFWGHTHKSQVMLTWDETETQPLIASYVVGAPTPFGGTNPTFRVYDFAKATGELLDYHEYRVDLKAQGFEHNMNPLKPPQWELAYSARAAYNMTSLSPQAWHSIAEDMKTNDALFHAWEFNYRTGNPEVADYSEHERQKRVCDILGGNANLVSRCMAGNFTQSALPQQ